MENWLRNKKLNEAYKITQLRDNTHHDEEISRDKEQHTRSNAKSYKQWLNHRVMQDRIDDIERARAMQYEMEALQREEAQNGIQ